MPTIFSTLQNKSSALAVVGLGYVGLPLAISLGRHFSVVGLDVSEHRIAELIAGQDHTGEVYPDALAAFSGTFTANPALLQDCSVIIVAVPTPIDAHHNPDLEPVEKASVMVGRNMRKGTVVVYESTVYPGVTEDVCVPILERESGLRFGLDFTVGYSPERINPGDRVHTLEKIVKVVSGSDAPTLELLSQVYGTIIEAGIHKASSIKVAEAAKVIENTQRDLNIALMNELALIFDRMGIDTLEVLEAAGSKWNFLPFRPGLVGGHCIGVDPYYLTFKAQELGYHPQVILAGRRINDDMGRHVAQKTLKLMLKAGTRINNARVGILGLTFKENVPDLRNTRVIDIVSELQEYGFDCLVHDPLADASEAARMYSIELVPLEQLADLDALILCVGHAAFSQLQLEHIAQCFHNPEKAILIDVKGFWSTAATYKNKLLHWRL